MSSQHSRALDLEIKDPGEGGKGSVEMHTVGIGIDGIEVTEGNEKTVCSATAIIVPTRGRKYKTLDSFNEGSGSVDVTLFSTAVLLDCEGRLKMEEPVRTSATTTTYIEGIVSRDANLETL